MEWFILHTNSLFISHFSSHCVAGISPSQLLCDPASFSDSSLFSIDQLSKGSRIERYINTRVHIGVDGFFKPEKRRFRRSPMTSEFR